MREIFPKVTGKTPLVGVCQRYIADISAERFQWTDSVTENSPIILGVIVKRMTSIGFEATLN